MEKEDCFFLGQVTKTFGFKGEVVIFLDVDNPENYYKITSMFLEVNSKLIPYFTESVNYRNKSNQLTVKFQDINTHEEAIKLQGCNIYLPVEFLPPLSGNAFYFHEVVGYAVIEKSKGSLGTINQILDYPGNPLFEINYENKQILIPVRDQFIEKLDRNNKTIYLTAPEGLLDIYLHE